MKQTKWDIIARDRTKEDGDNLRNHTVYMCNSLQIVNMSDVLLSHASGYTVGVSKKTTLIEQHVLFVD